MLQEYKNDNFSCNIILSINARAAFENNQINPMFKSVCCTLHIQFLSSVKLAS